MSTKNERIEGTLDKKPGEVGGPLVGYAEATRAEREAANAAPESTEDEVLAVKEFERLSGKPIAEMTEEEFIRIPVKLQARNKAAMTELNVIFKDPSMTGRWFNCKHKDGQRVTQAYMQGFTAATKDDVEFCHARASDANGALVMGDLVLLKMPKVQLWGGLYKDNVDKAKARVNRVMNNPREASSGYKSQTNPYVAADGNVVNSGQVDTYIGNMTSARNVDPGEAQRLVYSD